MRGYHFWNIMLCFLLWGFCTRSNGQQMAMQKVQQAKDSMITNPNYTYKLLSEVVVDPKIADSILAKTQLVLGSYFNDIGVVDSSVYYTEKALERLSDKKDVVKAYRTLGSCYRRSGNMENAIETLFKSLEICKKIGYQEMISKITSDLGILYVQKNDFEKALEFLKESIAEATDPQAVYGNYINIGVIYFMKEDLDGAEEYFKKGLEFLPSGKDPKVSATVTLNLGSVLLKKNKLKEAMAYFKKSQEIAETNGFKDKTLNAIEHQALVHQARGNYKEAIRMLTGALAPAKEISSLFTQKNIHENLVSIYTTTKNYEAANASLVSLQGLKDSISSRKQKKEITELEVKYETAKKEKEILALKEQQMVKDAALKREQLLKKMFLIGFLAVLVSISVLLVIYRQKLLVKNKFNSQKEEIHKQKISAFLKQQELELANTYVIAQNEERSRIARELHDSIGGNLAAIKLQMVDIQKHKGLEDTIINNLDDTYQQIREISHNLTPKKINQTAFTNYIREYIQNIEKVVDTVITFIPHPKEEINQINDTVKVEIFKILQELLTNALKHAQAEAIEICLNAYANTIEILFEDDGIGFDTQKETEGIGLKNIRKRLTLIGSTIDIDSVPERGTAIRIEIPNTKI